VLLYGRPGCHLCDEARARLEALRAEIPFELEERDIEDDESLHRRYLERIPVVVVGGEEVLELDFTEVQAREALAAKVHG
jgi:glutaredoxin